MGYVCVVGCCVVSVWVGCGVCWVYWKCDWGMSFWRSVHAALSAARMDSSLGLACGGASIKSPLIFRVRCAETACAISLLGSLRRMWPNHLCRRMRSFLTRLSEVDNGLASSWIVLPVKQDSILLFAPFSILIAFSFRSHDSHPYTRTEQTAAS